MSLVYPARASIQHTVMQYQERPPASNGVRDNPLFRIAPSSMRNSGMGVLASQPTGRGELIHAEQVLVVQGQEQVRTAQSIVAALYKQPTAFQDVFFNLPNAFSKPAAITGPGSGVDASVEIDAIVGIFNSNCLPLSPVATRPVAHFSLEPGQVGLSEYPHGVFRTLSKFNNSCCPNASITWDEATQVISVHAIEPIRAGEEVTICYGQPLFASRDERREYLLKKMGFWCTCRVCELRGEKSVASDQRRAELARLFKALPFLGHDAPAGLRAATQALQTLAAEGLSLYQDSFAYEAYQFCMLMMGATSGSIFAYNVNVQSAELGGYLQHAKRWLEHAHQWKVIISGRESEGAMFFAQLLTKFSAGTG